MLGRLPCGLGVSCASATAGSRARIWCQWSAFGSPVACAVVRSRAMVLFLFTCCLLLLPLWGSVVILCFAVRYFMSILDLQSS